MLNCLSILFIGNYVTKALPYKEERRATNIQPKNVGNNVLQRCIRQLINKNIKLFSVGFYDVCGICQHFLICNLL